MKRFEYKAVQLLLNEKFTEEINALGNSGWEMVSFNVNARGGYFEHESERNVMFCVFKRELQEETKSLNS